MCTCVCVFRYLCKRVFHSLSLPITKPSPDCLPFREYIWIHMSVYLCRHLWVGSLDLEGRLGKAGEDLRVMHWAKGTAKSRPYTEKGLGVDQEPPSRKSDETREMDRHETQPCWPRWRSWILFFPVFYAIWVSNQPWKEGVQPPISQTENWGLEYQKKNLPAICNNTDGPQGHDTKWNKSERERQHCMISFIWNLKNKTKKN